MRVEGIETHRAVRRREVADDEGRMLARIVEDGAIDEAREVPAIQRVRERRHAEAEWRREVGIARERPAPAHREDVKPVVLARQDLILAPLEELVEHVARRL